LLTITKTFTNIKKCYFWNKKLL